MSSKELQLRDYRPTDIQALFLLDTLCFEKPFRFSRSAMRKYAESSNARTVVADLGDELAGFGIFHIEVAGVERYGSLVTLDVHPDYRRRRIARALIRELHNQALSAGCSRTCLHVHDRNLAAIRFYESEGYVRQGVQQNFYGTGIHALVYRKELGVQQANHSARNLMGVSDAS